MNINQSTNHKGGGTATGDIYLNKLLVLAYCSPLLKALLFIEKLLGFSQNMLQL
jgi:hypothetical protein